MDVRRLPSGRLEGTIQTGQDRRAAAFSGTLELLKTIEDTLNTPTGRG